MEEQKKNQFNHKDKKEDKPKEEKVVSLPESAYLKLKEEADKASLLQLDYPGHLWLEKEIKSVANATRQDVREFLALAAKIPLKPEVQEFRLEEANAALLELKARKIRGAKVLRMN